MLLQHGADSGRAEELRKGTRRLCAFSVRQCTDAVDDVFAQRRRELAHDLDSRHREQFTDLLDTDLGGSPRHNGTHQFAGLWEYGLLLDCLGDSEPLDDLDELQATRAPTVGNR